MSQLLENKKYIGEIINNSYINSSIINDMNDLSLIVEWIKEAIDKDLIQFKSIFKMSENGTKSEDFHKFCDNKGPTLTIIKTTKNNIFGGFTPFNWNSNEGNICDELNQTFIFSLNSKKKFGIKEKNSFAIKNQSDCGPIFGNFDFGLRDNMKIGKVYATEKSSFLSINNLELIGENKNSEPFETEELEIFKVIY